jgi:hypothetical protein
MNAILEHAVDKVWCSPNIDNPSILAPARLTNNEGAVNQFFLFNKPYKLPVPGTVTHVYDLGGKFPLLLNLESVQYQWIKLSEINNWENTTITLYDDNGICLPLSNTYYMVTRNRNILLAVVYNAKLPTTFGAPIYLRTYQNSYFGTPKFQNSVPLNSPANKITMFGGLISSVDDVAAIQTQLNTLTKNDPANLIKYVCYLNGYIVPSINSSNTFPGDTAEVIYDPSIYMTRDFQIANLPTFTSLLDKIGKYLLHYNDSRYDNQIDFSGDIDMYLLDNTTNTGVYFHKNSVMNLRNVTHKDYSVCVPSVAALLRDPLGMINPSTAILRLVIRSGAYSRPLVNEVNQLRELYKLKDDQVQQALLGINSTVQNWRADYLENSAYPFIMGANLNQINILNTQACFGYDATIKEVAETPLPTLTFNSTNVASVGDAYSDVCDVYEYDINGLLIDRYVKVPGQIYNCANTNCAIAEPFIGSGADVLDEYFNASTVPLNPLYDYRMYISLNGTEPTAGQWVDITNTLPNIYYTIDSKNVLTWNIDPTVYNTYVLSNSKYLYRKIAITFEAGILPFNISRMTNINNPATPNKYVETEVFFPLGVLDVFLNGHQLIENIDYRVIGTSVIIYNKQYAIDGMNDIRYRNYSLPNTDLSRWPINEKGFVRDGAISVNGIYNIRDSKAIMVTVAGKRVLSSMVTTEEQNSYTMLSPLNGYPYQIQDAIVPIRKYYNVDTYLFRNDSKTIENNIDNYLSIYKPIVEPTIINPIVDMYHIYSPFISKLISMLASGNLIIPSMLTITGDNDIRTLVAPYMYVYSFDPCNPSNGYDERYVYCSPHQSKTQITITANQYSFLMKVMKLYTPKLTLSSFVEVIPNGN